MILPLLAIAILVLVYRAGSASRAQRMVATWGLVLIILQGVIGAVFNEAMQRVVRAFEDRAKTLYG